VHKLVLILRGKEEAVRLERGWSDEFVALAEKMPGLRRVMVGRAVGSPDGRSDVLLVHEFLFDDLPALLAGMTSPEGQAAGAALMRFAGDRAELLFAEHHEMAVGRAGQTVQAENPS